MFTLPVLFAISPNFPFFFRLTIILLELVCIVLERVQVEKLGLNHKRTSDRKSDRYPVGMSLNDEREWNLMLRAYYISGRVTLFRFPVLLFILLFIEKLPLQRVVTPILSFLLSILVISGIIILKERAFAFLYCYLDWQENR